MKESDTPKARNGVILPDFIFSNISGRMTEIESILFEIPRKKKQLKRGPFASFVGSLLSTIVDIYDWDEGSCLLEGVQNGKMFLRNICTTLRPAFTNRNDSEQHRRWRRHHEKTLVAPSQSKMQIPRGFSQLKWKGRFEVETSAFFERIIAVVYFDWMGLKGEKTGNRKRKEDKKERWVLKKVGRKKEKKSPKRVSIKTADRCAVGRDEVFKARKRVGEYVALSTPVGEDSKPDFKALLDSRTAFELSSSIGSLPSNQQFTNFVVENN